MSKTIHNSPAFLLHRRVYRGNSLLLDFLTQNFGLIRCIGRGVRKGKQTIVPFLRLNIHFSGKNDLKTLLSFEIDDKPRIMFGHQLVLGLYVNELLLRLLQTNEVYTGLLPLYHWVIEQLHHSNNHQKNQHWILRLFEKKLLAILGYGLDYQFDNLGQPILAECQYYFRENTGFILAQTGDISGILLLTLDKGEATNLPNDYQLRLSRLLLQTQLKPLLGNKPLKSKLLLKIREHKH